MSTILKDLGLVDRVFEIQKGKYSTYKKIIKELESETFDLLISPHESFTTGRFVRKIKSRKKIGYSKFWNLFIFDHRIERNWNLPEAIRQMELLTSLDGELKKKIGDYLLSNPPGNMNPVPDWASMSMRRSIKTWGSYLKLNVKRKYVCLFPGSVWATKQWTETGYRDLAQQLLREFDVILMGGKPEIALSERVSKDIPNVQILTGQTSLKETLQILVNAEFVVTNDSAGQHLAALADVPTVSIFGPTVLSFGFRPWNSKAVVVENNSLDCRPCGMHGHQICPKGHHRCMKDITADQVLKSIQLLQRQVP